jgi:hypothetical protein
MDEYRTPLFYPFEIANLELRRFLHHFEEGLGLQLCTGPFMFLSNNCLSKQLTLFKE